MTSWRTRPRELGTVGLMGRGAIGVTSAAVAVMLGLGAHGAAAQCCGDCNNDGRVVISELLTAVDRALMTQCRDDNVCSRESCPAKLAQCQTDLAICQSQPGGRRFPASGQTTSFGLGSDGDVRAGAALAYTDNGDGTITDHNTGLMWEKKDDSTGIHGQKNVYTWSKDSNTEMMNGTMVTVFLATLNSAPCFANYCDWRISNVRELQSIVDYQRFAPSVSVAFHNAAGCTGCTDVTQASCSCTETNNYWSATSHIPLPSLAWNVGFFNGYVSFLSSKTNGAAARAVRGGL